MAIYVITCIYYSSFYFKYVDIFVTLNQNVSVTPATQFAIGTAFVIFLSYVYQT